MTVSNELIERLSTETGRRLNASARVGRRRALAGISRFCVTVTVDGTTTHDVLFDQTPTMGELMDRVETLEEMLWDVDQALSAAAKA